MLDDVRVVEEEAGGYGTRGRYDPLKLWFPCSSSCSVVCARARAEVDTSAGRLSEAIFFCIVVLLFCIFL